MRCVTSEGFQQSQYSLFTIGTASEAELSNPKLLMWRSRERFEVICRLSPLIGDNFLKLG